jgi:hypothetical protein
MPSIDSNLDYALQVGGCGTNIGAEVNPRHFREAALAMINLMLPLPGLSPISALSACVGLHTSITTNKNLGGRRTIIPFEFVRTAHKIGTIFRNCPIKQSLLCLACSLVRLPG